MSDREHPTHKMRETSITAWLSLHNLGKQQQQVYDCILKHTKKGTYLTDREITRALGHTDPNKVRPRRYELFKAGLIIEEYKRICSISKKLALTWSAKKEG